MRRLCAWAWGLVFLTGCSATDGDSEAEWVVECSPGDIQPCLGEGDCSGTSVCSTSGSEWSVCDCALGQTSTGGSAPVTNPAETGSGTAGAASQSGGGGAGALAETGSAPSAGTGGATGGGASAGMGGLPPGTGAAPSEGAVGPSPEATGGLAGSSGGPAGGNGGGLGGGSGSGAAVNTGGGGSGGMNVGAVGGNDSTGGTGDPIGGSGDPAGGSAATGGSVATGGSSDEDGGTGGFGAFGAFGGFSAFGGFGAFGGQETGGSTGGDGGAGDAGGDSGGLGGDGGGTGGGEATGGDGAGSGGEGASGGSLSAEAAEYVQAHNEVRAEVTEPENYPGTWEPLPPVTWSEEVAASAQEWANHLRDVEDCNLVHASDTGYGENLAAGSGGMSPSQAVSLWADEKSYYVYNPRYEFTAGHYTQIVWRDSIEIGCASATCSRWTVVVCRYSPPGNYIGAQPY